MRKLRISGVKKTSPYGCGGTGVNKKFLYALASNSSVGKESACNAGDPSSIPGFGRFLKKGEATHSSILGLPLWLSW